MSDCKMLSQKPYLLRAFYDWIVESDCTPYLLLNAEFSRVKVPNEFVKQGQITLNIAPQAVRDLMIDHQGISFKTCFSGTVHQIYTPLDAVLSLFAFENGEGIQFEKVTEDESGVEGTGLHIVK